MLFIIHAHGAPEPRLQLHHEGAGAGGDHGGEGHWSYGGQARLSSPLQTVRTATPGILHPSLGTLDGGGQELPREGTAKSYQDGFRAQEQYL